MPGAEHILSILSFTPGVDPEYFYLTLISSGGPRITSAYRMLMLLFLSLLLPPAPSLYCPQDLHLKPLFTQCLRIYPEPNPGTHIRKHTIATFWLMLEEQGAGPGSRAAGLQVGWLGLLQKNTRTEEHKGSRNEVKIQTIRDLLWWK